MANEPSISDLLTAASRAVKGRARRSADYVRGSDYDVFAGVGAMVWSREAQRDTDLFKAVRFGTAEGKDLERLIWKRYGIERIKDTTGMGETTLERSTSGTAGTVWAGSRVRLNNAATGLPKTYVVTEDTPVASTSKRVVVPIRAGGAGTGWKVLATSNLELVDPIWDTTFQPTSLECSDGQVFETSAQFRARVRTQLIAGRRGHEAAIIAACAQAGADRVVLFRSDYGGIAVDHGLNVCYVGGLGYTSSPSLLRACRQVVHSVGVAGTNLQVLPMSRADLDVRATVYLQDSPSSYDKNAIYRANRAAILRHIGGQDGDFTYTLAGIIGSVADSHEAVREVVPITPSADATIITNGNFPGSLVRYIVRNVTIDYQPPR